jgi:hypothetical protein
MATAWPLGDDIDTYNSDLVVASIEVIVSNMVPTENHLIRQIIYLD